MTTKFLNQVKLTGTVTPSNAAIAASDNGQVVAEKLQGQINNINSTSSSAYAADLTGGVANNIPYQTAANTTSFIAPVNSAVLVSGATGIPSMSTTLPAVAAGACTVTDPTTGSSASINTALSNVFTYNGAAVTGLSGPLVIQTAFQSLTGGATLAAGKYYISFYVCPYTQTSAISTLQVITAQLYNVTASTVIIPGVGTIGGGASYFGGCLSASSVNSFSVPTIITVQLALNNITNVIAFGLYSAGISYIKLG